MGVHSFLKAKLRMDSHIEKFKFYINISIYPSKAQKFPQLCWSNFCSCLPGLRIKGKIIYLIIQQINKSTILSVLKKKQYENVNFLQSLLYCWGFKFIHNNYQSAMTANENFGIMDEGYFVPRTQIIAWIHDLLKINLSKIEELGSGAVYCQVIDAIYPGKVSMSKVNWRAKNDYEFIGNYKVLQNAFEKLGIKRYIEVQKLSKAKYQDNLEFIQWLKRYFDVNCADKGANYPAEERRGSVKIDFGFAEKIVVPKSYNAGGQVIPNKRGPSKERRAESGTSGQKESAKRLASPNVNDKVASRGKNSSNEKRGSIIQHKQSKQLIKKPPHPPAHLPPTPSSQKIKVQVKPETAEETYRPSKASAQELQRYKRLVRDLQSKLEMITEITQAGDDAETKLKLIEEVLSIGFSKFGKVSDFNSSNIYQDQLRHIDTIKTEEIKEEIVNQSHVFHHQLTKETTVEKENSSQSSRKIAPSEEQAF